MRFTISVTIATVCLFLSAAPRLHAEGPDIETFLSTRPDFKKLAGDGALGHFYTLQDFLADSAYTAERGDVVVTALVRGQEVIGFYVAVTVSAARFLYSDDALAAIRRAYPEEHYKEVASGRVSDAANGGKGEILVSVYLRNASYEAIREEQLKTLGDKLEP